MEGRGPHEVRQTSSFEVEDSPEPEELAESLDGAGGGARGPVLWREFHAPEMRAGGEELDADATRRFAASKRVYNMRYAAMRAGGTLDNAVNRLRSAAVSTRMLGK